MDFKSLQDQLVDLTATYQHQASRLTSLSHDKTEVQSTMDDLERQQAELNEKSANLKKQLLQHIADLEKAQGQQKKTLETYRELVAQYKIAKQKRNQALMQWWLTTYPTFDELSLGELKDWLQTVIAMHKPNSGGLRLKNGLLDEDPLADKTLDHKVLGSNDMNGTDVKKRQNHDAIDNNKSMTLAEKQRIFTNQVENNPIDTDKEVADRESFESPLGNRDVQGEIDKYEHEKKEITNRDNLKNRSKDLQNYIDGLDL